MIARWVLAALAIASASAALAPGRQQPATDQAHPSAAQQPAVQPPVVRARGAVSPRPDWIRISGDGVHIRSRPDRNSTVVASMDRGSVLRVTGEEYGWLRVEPPAQVYSLVSGEHIEVGPDGRGRVNVRSGNLRVRVGAEAADADPLRAEVQILLPDGAELRVRERRGDWLLIDPPEGVGVYVHSELTVPIGEAEARQWLEAERAARRAGQTPGRHPAGGPGPPEAGAASRPAAAAADGQKNTPPVGGPDLTGRWGRQLVQVESRIETEDRKDILAQDWAGTIASLRPLATQREEPAVARLAAGWIARLEERVADQTLVREARAIARRQTEAREKLEREREALEQARRRPGGQPAFDARGRLAASFAFDRAKHPRRYRLVSPLSDRIEAYVEFPESMSKQIEPLLGKLVGVRGQRRQEAGLDVDVIEVRDVVGLDPAPASQPARDPARRP